MLARLAQCIHRHQTPELFFVRKKKKKSLEISSSRIPPWQDARIILFRNRQWLEFGRDHNLKEVSAPSIYQLPNG